MDPIDQFVLFVGAFALITLLLGCFYFTMSHQRATIEKQRRAISTQSTALSAIRDMIAMREDQIKAQDGVIQRLHSALPDPSILYSVAVYLDKRFPGETDPTVQRSLYNAATAIVAVAPSKGPIRLITLIETTDPVPLEPPTEPSVPEP